MEIVVGFHSLTTTTHPPSVKLPSSGQQVTARLSAHKVSVAGGKQGPRTPDQGHYKLVKKFPSFHGTRRSITAFTSARHLSLSWATSIQSIPPHHNYWKSILYYFPIYACLPSGLFPSGFSIKTLYTPLPSPIRATFPAHLILLQFITRTILCEQYCSLSSPLCSFLHSLVKMSNTKYNCRPLNIVYTFSSGLSAHLQLIWCFVPQLCGLIQFLRCQFCSPSSKIQLKSLTVHITCKVKVKKIPLQPWTSPERSSSLRLPDFKTIGTWMW